MSKPKTTDSQATLKLKLSDSCDVKYKEPISNGDGDKVAKEVHNFLENVLNTGAMKDCTDKSYTEIKKGNIKDASFNRNVLFFF